MWLVHRDCKEARTLGSGMTSSSLLSSPLPSCCLSFPMLMCALGGLSVLVDLEAGLVSLEGVPD